MLPILSMDLFDFRFSIFLTMIGFQRYCTGIERVEESALLWLPVYTVSIVKTILWNK